jgi:hypothetical protein
VIDVVPTLVTVGIGLLLLVLVMLLIRGPARRFTRARAALRQGLAPRAAALQSLNDERLRHRR